MQRTRKRRSRPDIFSGSEKTLKEETVRTQTTTPRRRRSKLSSGTTQEEISDKSGSPETTSSTSKEDGYSIATGISGRRGRKSARTSSATKDATASSTVTSSTVTKRKLGDLFKNMEHREPDPDWRYLGVLSQEKDFIPNLEAELVWRTNHAERAFFRQGLPLYRVPVSEMENFETWPHVLPAKGIQPTLESRYVRLHKDAYQRAVVFHLYNTLDYLLVGDWEPVPGSGTKLEVSGTNPRRRRRKSTESEQSGAEDVPSEPAFTRRRRRVSS